MTNMIDSGRGLAVEARELNKYYGKLHALKNISISIKEGEVLGLLGHNGAGKSTLMKLILGIIQPNSGSIHVLGHSPYTKKSHTYRTQFGYLPENVSFYDQLSGFDVLTYFAKLKGFGKDEATRLLEQVGLSHAAARQVKTYSKGMRQRLGLAQAFIGQPKLLVLDEPTVGLDPMATKDFYQMVDTLKSQGTAVILCTHVLQGIEDHIDRACIMGSGEVLAIGEMDTLRRSSELPVRISFHGSAANEVANTFVEYKQDATTSSNIHAALLHVPVQQKMRVVRHLSQHQHINDIEIIPPSLQDIYTRFMQGKKIDHSTRAK